MAKNRCDEREFFASGYYALRLYCFGGRAVRHERCKEGIPAGSDVSRADRAGGTGSPAGLCLEPGAQDSAGSDWDGFLRKRSREYRVLAGYGKGIQLAVSKRDGADSLADSGLSLAGSGSISCFRDFYREIFFCDGTPQRALLIGGVYPHFLFREENQRIGSGERGGLAMGALSQRRDDAVRMGVGHLPGGAAGSR